MEAEFGILRVPTLEAIEEVDLLGGLALAQQLIQRLGSTRLNPRESVHLERMAQRVKDALFNNSAVRQPLGKSRKGGNLHDEYSLTTNADSSSWGTV